MKIGSVALLILSLLVLSGLSGCEKKEKESPPPARQERTIRLDPGVSEKALATREKIAEMEVRKSIELQKIDAQTRLKQLELEKERELALLREKERLLRLEHEQAKERYIIWAGIAAMILIGLALLWYFDRRRQDKLIAYRDNLHKYFLFKENETRMKIAEKIIDTVAKQEISAEEKSKLIEVLHSPIAEGRPALPPEVAVKGEEPAVDRKQLPEKESEEPEEERNTVIDVEEEPELPEEPEKKKPWYRFW
ncbi:hypothetical protein [Nitratifractor sp.]